MTVGFRRIRPGLSSFPAAPRKVLRVSSDPGRPESAVREVDDVKRTELKLLTGRDKYENSYWMEHLPAHVWVQDGGNSVVFSNRLPLREQTGNGCANCRSGKISCCREFRGREETCPCCPYQRITETLQPENCLCRRDRKIYHVYHYPFAPNGEYHDDTPPFVMKIEIEADGVFFKDRIAESSLDAHEESPGRENADGRFVAICSTCKKIRNQSGRWVQLEKYFNTLYGIKFSHGLCEECACRLYPGVWLDHP